MITRGIAIPLAQPAAPVSPYAYDFTLTDTLDDALEILVGGSFGGFYVASSSVFDSDGNTNGRNPDDGMASWSFPLVTATTCSEALLRVVVYGLPFGTCRFRGEKNAGTTRFSAAHLPSSVVANATTAIVSGQALAPVGMNTYDLTAIVVEIMAATWASGDRINLWAEATSAFASGYFRSASNPQAARLTIIP